MTNPTELEAVRAAAALRDEAAQAGDLEQVAICEIALYDRITPATTKLLGLLTSSNLEMRYPGRYSALAECQRVIANARA